MDLPRSSSAILLIMLIGWPAEVLVKGDSVEILTTTYRCSPSSEMVVNLSAYNLSCDTLMASINNKPVIVQNNFSLPITNFTPDKNFTIRGCHTIEYICDTSVKSGNVEKHIIINGIENHMNNTDEGIKDSGGHLTDGIENHKNNTEGKKSSRSHFILGISVGFVIFIFTVVLGVIVVNRVKIKRWLQSCCQQEEFPRSQRLAALQEVI
ncbi:uncharacterized protein [Hemitrygon akajei]|uniref:uncharacterized protein n=1 Tax=Hemitrygon akajei TaxID=2704970 RepID=UPI003BF9B499